MADDRSRDPETHLQLTGRGLAAAPFTSDRAVLMGAVHPALRTPSPLAVNLPLGSGNPGEGYHGITTAVVPRERVMSPTQRPMPRPCVVCHRPLGGPLVVCSQCGSFVHSHCMVSYMHEVFCENCNAHLQELDAARRAHAQAARTLGLAGARSSEALGTAFGAVAAAGAAATRYFVEGARAGARSALAGGSLP